MSEQLDERAPLLAVVRVEPRRPRYRHSFVRRLCTILLSAALAVVVLAFLLPAALLPHPEGPIASYLPWARPLPHETWPETSGIDYARLQDILLSTPREDEARKSSRHYASGPHLAGTNLSQAIWTKNKWQDSGISSSIVSYDVYLNYPVDHRLALLELSGEDRGKKNSRGGNKVIYECKLEEDILEEDPTTGLEDRVPTFHGYSASGNATAPYVYVNYGTYYDFQDLIHANVSLKGKIALAKYGGVFRGLKVKRAQELGMLGVVMYSDPQDDGNMTESKGHKAYPHGPARNPSSVQRGSTQFLSILPGDPTTPGVPSKPGVHREDPYGSIPRIPSLPISYLDALPLLKALNGHGPESTDFNKHWQGGGLTGHGVKYNIGPTPDSIVLNLRNEQEYVTTPIWNVIGVINGSISDEVVVLGNHRDAWIAGGAGDPNSGSAALNEMIRSFGEATKAGWKPLRTLVFASWDGEEYGLIGSTEWVEEYLPWLSATTVAYLNVDMGAYGPVLTAAASPLLNRALRDALAEVPSPNQTVKGQTIFDTWDKKIRTMGSGSDFTAFQDFAGIPSLDISFKGGPDHPVYHYHSNYDSSHWMETFGDPNYKYHLTITKIWSLIAASLCESPVLKLNATDYALGLSKYLDSVKSKAASSSAQHEGAFFFHPLDRAISNLYRTAIQFDSYTASLTSQLGDHVPWWKWWKKVGLFHQVRRVNTKYKMLERQFLHQDGLDGRSWFKHVVFAPGKWTGYSGATFPGLVESFEDGNLTNAERWKEIILGRLNQATELLSLE